MGNSALRLFAYVILVAILLAAGFGALGSAGTLVP
jgi:hypothetical protein